MVVVPRSVFEPIPALEDWRIVNLHGLLYVPLGIGTIVTVFHRQIYTSSYAYASCTRENRTCALPLISFIPRSKREQGASVLAICSDRVMFELRGPRH